MIKYSILFLTLFTVFSAVAQDIDPNLSIIPAPKNVKINQGKFVVSRESGILFETEEDQKIAIMFQSFLHDNYFIDIPVAKAFIRAPKGAIRFSLSDSVGLNPEAYTLTVDTSQIKISGNGPGLFYGLQSLMQMFPIERSGAPAISCVAIADEPRYKYRGMHLDVSRTMFPVSFVKQYIDMLAKYKFNNFHWHLTDDQGWRIEIKKYPKLTSVGGYRAQTLIGNYHDRMPQWFDGTPYGGFYTQEDVKEVLAYAAARYINVIPEIEMPGHAMAALASYPELACGDNPGPFKTAEKWGVFEDVFCPGKETTFAFLEDVLVEVIDLFPSHYIHIGGDECPKTKWKQCRFCQQRMRDNKLKNENQLQSYFIRRMEKFVNSRGRTIIGWDEILQGGLAPNATVMGWTTVAAGLAAAKQNHDVIMTPGTYLYMDHLQGRADQEPLTIGGYTPLQEVYSYNPTPTDLTPLQQSHIIGVQANVWTEYMTTQQKVQYMTMPRIYAVSEIAWTAVNRKDFIDFSEVRVPKHLAKIDNTEIFYRVPPPIGAKDTVVYAAQYSAALKPSVTGAKMYYTIDGYNPRETDKIYSVPVQIAVPAGERRVFKTVAVTPSGKRSAVTTTTIINESPMQPLDSVASAGKVLGLKYYYVPGDFEITASIDTFKAAEKGITSALNLTKFRNKARTYGLVFDGFLNILQTGVYSFSTSSDDGSGIWIDGKQVVENDGKHAVFELNGVASLVKGLHKIQIRYFQGGGGNELRVYMTEPGKSKSELPPNLLFN